METYWANTSSNGLVGKLIQEGSKEVKLIMESLLNGGSFHTRIDEQIVFSQLDYNEYAIWSLFLAGGYLKVEDYMFVEETGKKEYDLRITNKETKIMFENMVEDWFKRYVPEYNDFIKALLQIEEKQYAASLVAEGILAERIRKYGFAFEGKKVLIGG